MNVVLVRAFLTRLAELCRTAGMQLQTQCGPLAHELWESVFDQIEREIEMANWPLMTDDEIRATRGEEALPQPPSVTHDDPFAGSADASGTPSECEWMSVRTRGN